jgi:hypothetical protein
MNAMTASIAVCMAGLLSALAVPSAANDPPSKAISKPLRVTLVGASIGQDWRIQDLPSRVPILGYEFEAVQAWQFDKSELLEETLMRPARKFRLTRTYFKGFFKASPQPADVILIKECSSYFPGDGGIQREMIERWVQRLKESNTQVMLATVVPVTKKRAAQDIGKQEAVREFNDWIRGYAQKNHIVLLDLEAATRTDNRDRYLRDDLDVGDGSHLNRKAYDIMDGVMVQAICRLESNSGCASVQALAK